MLQHVREDQQTFPVALTLSLVIMDRYDKQDDGSTPRFREHMQALQQNNE